MPFSITAFMGRLDETIAVKGTNRAEVCRDAGINHSSIDSWAKGSIPSVEKAVKVSEVLRISLSWLLTGNDDISPEERLMLWNFRQLDQRDRDDIIGNIKMKLDNAKKGAISSSSGNA
jgi:transcriptional regulator with XRE-family HTH domain